MTTTTPEILWVEGNLAIIVYDLTSDNSIPVFIQDMRHYRIFERSISDAVWGVEPSIVQIMSIVPSSRRLQFLAAATTTRPPPAPRWLDSHEKEFNPAAPTPPPSWVVRQPTALEAPGVKWDGKSGGPRKNAMNVFFRILVGDDKMLAHKALRELNDVNPQAMTFQFETMMEDLNLPRSYIVAITSVDAYPAVEMPELNETNASNMSGMSTTSLAASHLRPKRLFPVAWLCAVIGVVVAAHSDIRL